MVQKWDLPVKLRLPPYRVWTIRSTEDAGRYLINRWPDAFRNTQAHVDAQHACVEALAESSTPERAREMFIAAAREAGLLEGLGP